MGQLQPTLENDLVLLRPLAESDFESLYQVAKDPQIWALHQNPDRFKLSVFKPFFEEALNFKSALVVIDKKENSIIGSSRYRVSAADPKAVEIGWTFLARTHWGGTYNQSLKSLMIQHAFNFFNHVLFNVDQNNLRSQKAVQKIGGKPIAKAGPFGHLHTAKPTGLSFIIHK